MNCHSPEMKPINVTVSKFLNVKERSNLNNNKPLKKPSNDKKRQVMTIPHNNVMSLLISHDPQHLRMSELKYSTTPSALNPHRFLSGTSLSL